jgi:MoaA/NifB/PqqE/SkfB family radical SAM enzyme
MRRYLNVLTPGVKYLILRVTNRCNAKCSFCLNRYYQSSPGLFATELSVEEYERIATHLPGLVLLNLSGGEPYLRSDLAEIAEAFIRRAGVRLISSPTNGSFPDQTVEFAGKVLADHKGVLLKVGISIDGIGEQHEEIRGIPGGYDKALETARRLKELKKKHANLMVYSVTTVSAANVRSLDAVMDELASLSLFDGLLFTLVRGHGAEMRLSKEEFALYQQASARLLREKNESSLLKDRFFKAIIKAMSAEIEGSYLRRRNTFVCRAGDKLINITEQGELCICELLENSSLGNLRVYDYDVGKILHLPATRDRLKKLRQQGCDCHWDCAIYSSLLFGGAPGYGSILRNLF